MQPLQQEVIVDVTRQVTSNVATNIAQRLWDIIAKKLNDKFIVELHASKEWPKNSVWWRIVLEIIASLRFC